MSKFLVIVFSCLLLVHNCFSTKRREITPTEYNGNIQTTQLYKIENTDEDTVWHAKFFYDKNKVVIKKISFDLKHYGDSTIYILNNEGKDYKIEYTKHKDSLRKITWQIDTFTHEKINTKSDSIDIECFNGNCIYKKNKFDSLKRNIWFSINKNDEEPTYVNEVLYNEKDKIKTEIIYNPQTKTFKEKSKTYYNKDKFKDSIVYYYDYMKNEETEQEAWIPMKLDSVFCTEKYVYNAKNRLEKMLYYDGNKIELKRVEFKYDKRNRLIAKMGYEGLKLVYFEKYTKNKMNSVVKFIYWSNYAKGPNYTKYVSYNKQNKQVYSSILTLNYFGVERIYYDKMGNQIRIDKWVNREHVGTWGSVITYYE